jgi:hypothetical protein
MFLTSSVPSSANRPFREAVSCADRACAERFVTRYERGHPACGNLGVIVNAFLQYTFFKTLFIKRPPSFLTNP